MFSSWVRVKKFFASQSLIKKSVFSDKEYLNVDKTNLKIIAKILMYLLQRVISKNFSSQ